MARRFVHGKCGVSWGFSPFYFDQETHEPVGQQVHVMELGNAQATDKPLSHYLPSPD